MYKVLVTQHSADNADPLFPKIFLNTAYRCINPLGIVSSVKDYKGVFADYFKSRRPSCLTETSTQSLLADRKAHTRKNVNSIKNNCRIPRLIAAEKG